jgi:hypothetical protein
MQNFAQAANPAQKLLSAIKGTYFGLPENLIPWVRFHRVSNGKLTGRQEISK